MIHRYSFFSLLFILAFFQPLFAQQKKGIEYSGFFDTYYFRGPVNFTIGGGLTSFQGDLNPLFKGNVGYFASLGASYQVWPRTYFGADFSFVNLTGGSSDSSAMSFSNTGIQADAFCRFLLIDKKVIRHSQLKQHPYYIRPYIMTGVGVYYGLNTSVSGVTPVLTGENTVVTGFPKYALTIPAGIGFQIWFSHRVSILPEFIYRFAFTDNLDGLNLPSSSGKMDGYATVGLKVQITPTAPRVKPKKRSLAPPEQYDGPKGTDYPRKTREEPKPKRYGQPYELPDENQDNGGGLDEQQDENGGDTGGEENGGDNNGGDNTGNDNNGDGGFDSGEQQDNNQNQDQQQNNDSWGW